MPKFLILFVAFAQGCAAVTWYKDGATRAMYEEDQAQCDSASYTVPSNGSLTQALDRVNFRLACMKGKGWRDG